MTDPPPEYLDHICREGDEPCDQRVPSGRYYRKGPLDMAPQCRTCRFVRHCLVGEFDIEFIPIDYKPEREL